MTTQVLPSLTTGGLAVSLVKAFPRKRAKWAAIMNSVPAIEIGARCLDIGTAYGGLTAFYAKSGDWTYLDRNANHLEVARELLQGRFVQSDLLPFLDQGQSFDLITMVDTLMYFPNPKAVLEHLSQSLLPNGALVITGMEHENQGVFAHLRRLLGISDATGGVSEISQAQMVAWLLEAGLTVEKEVFYFGPFSQALQSAIDWVMMRSAREQEDLLTRDLKTESSELAQKKAWLPIATTITTLVGALDQMLPFLPRYAYVVRARKTR